MSAAVYVIVDGIKWCCQFVRRNAGVTAVCAKCKQGVAWRLDSKPRKKCRVCGSKIIVEFLGAEQKGTEWEQ